MILDITKEAARHYAALREEPRAAGTPLPENDVWIAFLAREHGLAVLSRVRRFDVVKGLIRHGW